jgi:hypothetical protein
MDRLNRALAGAGLALALTVVTTATGCRSLRSEVPPGRPYTGDGKQSAPIEFSSTPGTSALNGLPTTGPGATGSASAAAGQVGVPVGGPNAYGLPTGNTYGAPGSAGMSSGLPGAGLGAAPSAGATTGSGLPPATAPGGASDPSTGIPQSGISPLGPAAGSSPSVPGAPGQFPAPQ